MLIVAVSFLIGCRYGRRTANEPGKPIISMADTSSSVESFEVERPKIKDSTVIHHVYVKVKIDQRDSAFMTTLNGSDSVRVEMPIERKIYQEDSVYRAVVSGYRPSLDSLLIFSKTTTITVHEKSPAECRPYSWTLFPQAAVNYGGGALEMKASIGADISISENGRWRFGPEFGYRALQVNDRIQKGCYAEVKIKYNLIQVK